MDKLFKSRCATCNHMEHYLPYACILPGRWECSCTKYVPSDNLEYLEWQLSEKELKNV